MDPVKYKGCGPLVLIVGLFFLWGMANNLNDVLIAQFRRALMLGDFQSGLVQSAFYMGYFCFAIPAALFMRRAGYQRGVVLGLMLFGGGALLFWPAAATGNYMFFLFALFVIASGLAFLETAANPLVATLGAPEAAARRLNLVQAFNPLGSIAGIELGRRFILGGTAPVTAADRAAALTAVQMPYAMIGVFVLLWCGLVAISNFHNAEASADTVAVGSIAEYRQLLGDRRFVFGVSDQFCYVGAQVGLWSYLIRFAQMAVPGTAPAQAAGFVIVALVLFALGRFAGSAMMGRWSAARILMVCAGVNVLLCFSAALSGGQLGVWALVAASMFMSVMYPTIFALTISGLGGLARAGSSLLVMAIVGGAVITAIMGRVSDLSSIRVAVLVPALCFAMVFAFARSERGGLV